MAPLWTVSVHAPEVADEFERLGLEPSQRYFAARAAPLGAASLELVVATFFNFSPRGEPSRSRRVGHGHARRRSSTAQRSAWIVPCGGRSRRWMRPSSTRRWR